MFETFNDLSVEHNLKLVEIIKTISSQNQVTPALVALCWLLKQGKDIVPIPDTKQSKYLEENVKSASINLPFLAWQALEKGLANFKTAGKLL